MDIQEQIKISAIALRNQVTDNEDKKMIEYFLMALIGKYTIVLSPIEHSDDNKKEYLQKHLRYFLSVFSESDYSCIVCDKRNDIGPFRYLQDNLKQAIVSSLEDFKASFVINPEKRIDGSPEKKIFECEKNKYAFSQLDSIIKELKKYQNYGNK